MTDKTLSKKAMIELDDLENDGGLLSVEQNETFIRRLEDSPTILNAIRVYPMSGPSVKINSIGFGDFITYPDNYDPTLVNANYDGRKFKEPYRSKAITKFVSLNSKGVKAVVYIPYEVLEDNIERGALQQTLVSLISDKFALNMEAMIVQGQAGGSSPHALLNYMDGIYAKANDHVVNAAGAPLSDDLFLDALKTLPTKYRGNLSTLRFMTGSNAELDVRRARASRQTALGDAFLTGQQPVDALGVRIMGAANNPETQMLLTPPQNIIFGIQRNIRIETDREIEESMIKIVVTARVDVQIETLDACVKVTNLASQL